MTPEEQKVVDDQAAAEAATKAAENPPVTPEVKPEGKEEQDPTGVSYKNRLAESERKREQLAESVEEMSLRMNSLEQKVQPPTQPATPPDAPSQKKSDMDEMIALGPEVYGLKLQQKFQLQQAEKAAIDLVKEEYGTARAQYGVQKVLDYAQKNMIDLKSDPIRAVKKILSDMKQPKSKPSPESIKKTADALKNKPEGGKRPPAPPVNTSSELMKAVYERGDIEDIQAALQEQMRLEDEANGKV